MGIWGAMGEKRKLVEEFGGYIPGEGVRAIIVFFPNFNLVFFSRPIRNVAIPSPFVLFECIDFDTLQTDTPTRTTLTTPFSAPSPFTS